MSVVTSGRYTFPSYNLVFFIFLQLGLHSVEGVWPLPQFITSSPERYPLNPQAFYFTYGSQSAAQEGCSVLDEAFKRYFSLIFPDYSSGRFYSEVKFLKCKNEVRFKVLLNLNVVVVQSDCLDIYSKITKDMK